MELTKTKGTVASLSAIALIIAAFLGGANITDQTYYCESKDLLWECNRFSSTGGRCYPTADSKVGYKDCKSGWIKAKQITDEYLKTTTTTTSTTTTLKKELQLVKASLNPTKDGKYELSCVSPEGLPINIADVCVPAFKNLKELYKLEKERAVN